MKEREKLIGELLNDESICAQIAELERCEATEDNQVKTYEEDIKFDPPPPCRGDACRKLEHSLHELSQQLKTLQQKRAAAESAAAIDIPAEAYAWGVGALTAQQDGAPPPPHHRRDVGLLRTERPRP